MHKTALVGELLRSEGELSVAWEEEFEKKALD